MNKEQIFYDINTLKQKIIELFALEYGDIPSRDELIKFGSLDQMKSKPLRLRNHFLRSASKIYNNYSNKEIIDYILTLSHLTINNYPIMKFCDNESLLILYNVYSGLLTDDYEKYNKIMDKRRIMSSLVSKINNIVGYEGWERRKVVTRSICNQFIKRYEQLLQSGMEFSKILSTIPKEIDSFICVGHKLDLGESITDIPLIKNKR
ncbi:MAG: hypothetical protein V8Q75_01040 [Bacilli bacterium]